MTHIDIFKPIRIFGYSFILMGIIGLLMHFLLQQNNNYTIEFVCFVLTLSFFHFLIGVGVILKKTGVIIFLKFIFICYILHCQLVHI